MDVLAREGYPYAVYVGSRGDWKREIEDDPWITKCIQPYLPLCDSELKPVGNWENIRGRITCLHSSSSLSIHARPLLVTGS